MTDPKKLPVKQIALDKLVISPDRNVRRMVEDPIEPLAAAIDACGLLQNLVVHAMTKGVYGVCAGGRRLAALQHNRDAGLIPADHKIACVVVDEADARQVSLAENFARTAMNPADEARAFADLIAEGRTHAEVAAAFGQTERYVKARERLGRLADPVFAAFQAREMSIEQAQAFAVNDDVTRQAEVFAAWDNAQSWERSAIRIKEMMTEDRVRPSDPRAKLVGRDAYEAAGGDVDEDLFGEQIYFRNAGLLDTLATAILEAAVDAETANGWRWGAVMLAQDFQVLRSLTRLTPQQVPLSETDQLRWDAINETIETEELDDDAYDALMVELDALDAKTTVFTDAQKAASGVVATIDRDGDIRLEFGLQRPEDVEAAASDTPAATDGAGDGPASDDGGAPAPERVVIQVGGGAAGAPAEKPKRDPYSAALRDDLRSALQGAIQLAIAEDPALARDLLEFETVMAARARYGWRDRLLAIRYEAAPARFEHDGWALDAERAKTAVADCGLDDDTPVAAAFAAFRALPAATRDALLANAVADSARAALPDDGGVNDYHDRAPLRAPTAHIVNIACPDLRRTWTPTASNFLGRVSKAVLLEIVSATLGDDQARLMMGAKKGELVELLHNAFNEPDARAKLTADQRAALDAWTPAPVVFPDALWSDGADAGVTAVAAE